MLEACVAAAATFKHNSKADVARSLDIPKRGYDSIALPRCDVEFGVIRLGFNTCGDPRAFVMAPESSKKTTLVSNIGIVIRLKIILIWTGFSRPIYAI